MLTRLLLSLFSPTPPRIESTATTFTRGTDALKTLRERRDDFDIVLSDVHMPDMDGFKLLEAVALELDVPVMMMSANSATEVVLRGIIHGAVDYLLKPVRIEEIRNIWQHVVRRRRDDGTVQDLLDPQSSGGRGAASEGSQGSKDAGERGGAGKKGNSSAKGASAKKRGADALAANDSGETNSGSGKARNGKGGKNQGADGGDEGNGKGADGGAGPQNGSGGRGEHEDSSALKKPRVVWSAELHQQFVTAVNQLGIDKAVPKRILDLMGVQGLTRENVASHLQKYRLYLKRLQGVSAHAAGVGGNPGFMTGLTIDGAGNVMGPPGGRIGSPALGGPASGSPTHAMGMPGMAGGGAPVGGMPHGAGGLTYRMAPPPLGVPGGKMQGGAPNGGVHPHGQPYVIAHGQVGAANGAPVMMQGGMGPGPGGMGPGPGGVMQMRAGGAPMMGRMQGGAYPVAAGMAPAGAMHGPNGMMLMPQGSGSEIPPGMMMAGQGGELGGNPGKMFQEEVPGGPGMGPGPGGDALGDEVLDMFLKDGLPEGEF